MDRVRGEGKKRARNWEKRKTRVRKKERVKEKRKRKGQKRKKGCWKNEINLAEKESSNSETSVYYLI